MFDSDKFLVKLEFATCEYSVRATAHARERMITRGVEEFTVVGNIIALGELRLKELQRNQEEVVVVDELNDSAFVVGFKKNTLHVITVLDSMNIYNNRGTKMIRITERGIL